MFEIALVNHEAMRTAPYAFINVRLVVAVWPVPQGTKIVMVGGESFITSRGAKDVSLTIDRLLDDGK